MTSSPLPAVFALLRSERNAAVDAALVEALPDLDRQILRVAFAMLVERGDVPSLAAVVGRFNESNRALQSLILEHVRDLFTVVRRAMTSPVFEERAGAVEVIVRSESAELAYLMADALRSPCARTRELAAVGLHRMTDRLFERSSEDRQADRTPGRCGPANHLAQALQPAVMSWELHLQPKVLEAAAWMADRLAPTIRKKLEEPRTRIARALNDVLAGTPSPRLVGFALRALAMPALRTSAARAIGGARDPDFIHAVLSEGRLLADPEIRHGCRWIRDSRWLHREVDELLTLDGEEAVTAVGLVDATGGPHECRMQLYSRLLGSGGDDLRRAVLGRLVEDPSRGASDLLTVAACRGTGELALIAAGELRRRLPDGAAERAGQRTHHETADGLAARRAFEQLWKQFDPAVPEETRPLLEVIRSCGADPFVSVRAKLASSSPVDRARALRVAQSFAMSSKLQEQIYGLAHDPDPVVRSLAVRMLAELPGVTSLRILRTAVDDPDPRVQANAIEALDRLDCHERIPVTEAKLDSSHNRVRANAIKSLLRVEVRKAGEVLLDMLEHPSRAHRLSALWVVKTLRLRALYPRIHGMSRHDRDEHVKKSANRILQDLSGREEARNRPPERSREPVATRQAERVS